MSLIAVLFILYCSDKGTYTEPSYSDLIKDYILNDENCKELYTSELFSAESFLYESTGYLCFYKFDSSKKYVTVKIGTAPTDIFPYEDLYDALAKVVDRYYGYLMRINGNDTIPLCYVENTVTRYGYFVKLYNDSYPYRGWRHWGFIGGDYKISISGGQRKITSGGGITITATPPSKYLPNPTNPNDSGYYINLDDIKTISPGDSLTLKSLEDDLVFIRNHRGKIAPLRTVSSGVNYTAGWRAPTNTSILYQLVTFDLPGYFVYDTVGGIPESSLYKDNDYVIPYRLDL
jgi:hypothetical protein